MGKKKTFEVRYLNDISIETVMIHIKIESIK